MTGHRKYRKPPVVEALCEIYFASSTWDETVPGRFYDRVKGRFPLKRQQEVQEAEVAFSAEGEAAARVRKLAPRMQFLTERKDRLVQLSRDLLVINQLLPYPRFEDWEPEINFALAVYRELAEPKGASRLGVRYINKVVIPQPTILMEDYFTIYPRLPEALGDQQSPFMLRAEFLRQRGHAVLVTFGSAPAEKPGESAHLLDLYDIFKPDTIMPLEAIREEVGLAHDNIEDAFESSITDGLRVLFEPEDQA